jgi:hypothetical protein
MARGGIQLASNQGGADNDGIADSPEGIIGRARELDTRPPDRIPHTPCLLGF